MVKKSKKPIIVFILIIAIIIIGVTLYFATRTAEPPLGGKCGNKICEFGETWQKCPNDCINTEAICGDGVCELGERCCEDCPNSDCGGIIEEFCGDGICQPSRGEDKYQCPLDCGLPLPICGDGKCQVFHYSPKLPPYSSDIIDEFEVCPEDCGGDGKPKEDLNNEELIYELNQKQRPLVGGISLQLSRKENRFALCTLGAIVNYGGKKYILTAGHCVTDGEDGFPDPDDIGLEVKQGDEIIGYVYKTDFTGGVDASLISIKSGVSSEVENFLGNEINGFGNVYEGLKVFKIGRSTGLTFGTVTDTNIWYTDINGKQIRGFEVTGENGKFSESGDSGSAIITVNEPHKIVGIISAGDGSNLPEDIKNKLGL